MKTKILAFILFLFIQYNVLGQAVATSDYATQTGALGTSYSWIDCSSGTQFSFSPNQDQTVSLSSLSRGLYILRIEDGFQQKSFKLLVNTP